MVKTMMRTLGVRFRFTNINIPEGCLVIYSKEEISCDISTWDVMNVMSMSREHPLPEGWLRVYSKERLRE